jgi:hypothetical protein
LISMRASPFRLPLYLTAVSAVMLAAAALMLGQTTPAETTRREAARKGPRAIALLELAANDKARLIPITVMSDGKFYDAGSYKASPVPMALQRDTVYEAVRTGVSQGLFTVMDAFHRGNLWVADGKWEPAGAVPPKKRPSEPTAPRDDDQDKPPVLRRPSREGRSEVGSETPKIEPPSAPAANPPVATSPESTGQDSPPDKDRPVLRRGKQASTGAEEKPKTRGSPPAPAPTSTVTATKTEERKTVEQKAAPLLIPAVSDAVGSDPRPYSYTIKSTEEQQLRKKMLAMASTEIRDRARQSASESSETAAARTASQKIKTPAANTATTPTFEDTQFRILDLSTSNEPVLVLTSKARLPVSTRISRGEDVQYYVALVAREDVSGELHKAFSNVTDSRHLDIQPRLELIDAVDADGDGRGELLFRQISDTGSAFVIYRVIGDQLWALFQGTPE